MSTARRAKKTKGLIRSFEYKEGLDPEREDNTKMELIQEELHAPGTAEKLASLFGGAANKRRSNRLSSGEGEGFRVTNGASNDVFDESSDVSVTKVEKKSVEVEGGVSMETTVTTVTTTTLTSEEERDGERQEVREAVAQKVEEKVEKAVEERVEKGVERKVEQAVEERKEGAKVEENETRTETTTVQTVTITKVETEGEKRETVADKVEAKVEEKKEERKEEARAEAKRVEVEVKKVEVEAEKKNVEVKQVEVTTVEVTKVGREAEVKKAEVKEVEVKKVAVQKAEVDVRQAEIKKVEVQRAEATSGGATTKTVEVTRVEVTTVEVDKSESSGAVLAPLARGKKVLVVYAHVFKESYEGCLVGAAVKALKDAGAHIQVSNLYDSGFNPVASPRDFGDEVPDKEFYSYPRLAGAARASGRLAQDIVAEQDKVAWADLVVFVAQLTSHGLPALLKGWFDRVLTADFAYGEGQIYDNGKLSGKKALLCLTSEALSSMYTSTGVHGDINVYLWPLVYGLMRFPGFEVLRPQVYFGSGRASEDYREKTISTLQQRVLGVWAEQGIDFIPTERFSAADGFCLGGAEQAALGKAGRSTVGQHLGGPLPGGLGIIVEPDRRGPQEHGKGGVSDRKPWYTY